MILQRGDVDQTAYIGLVDANGDPVTTVTSASSGLTITVVRPKEATISITPAAQTVTGAHTDGGICHVSGGLYRVDVTDASVADTNTPNFIVLIVGGVTGVKTSRIVIPLSTATDPALAYSLADFFQQMYAGDVTTITSPAAKSLLEWMRMGALPLNKAVIDNATGKITSYEEDETTIAQQQNFTGSIPNITSMDRV